MSDPDKDKLIFDGPVTSGQLRRRVWKLSWPSISEQFLNLLVGFSEIFFMGHLSQEATAKLGYGVDEAMTSVALASFYNWIAMVIFSSLGIATTTLVAQSYGAQRYKRAGNIALQTLILGLGVGISVTLSFNFFASQLMALFGANSKVTELGAQYIQIASLGMTFWCMGVIGAATLRGSGDARTPLKILTVMNLVNIGVVALLVNGNFGLPALGVQGSGIAAAVCWTVAGLIAMARLFGIFGRKEVKDGPPPIYLHFGLLLQMKVIRMVLKIGWPTFGEQMIYRLGIFAFARIVINLGDTNYAAFNTIINVDAIAFLPATGVGTAATVLVGQSIGAKRYELAERYTYAAFQLGFIFTFLVGLVLIVSPQIFLGLLVNDPKIVEAATDPLRIAGLFEPFQAAIFIFMGALRGAADTKYPMYARLISTWGGRVLFGLLLVSLLGWGLAGARVAMGLEAVLMAALIFIRFRNGNWKAGMRKDFPSGDKPSINSSALNPAISKK